MEFPLRRATGLSLTTTACLGTWRRPWQASTGPTFRNRCRNWKKIRAPLLRPPHVQAESHFKGRDLNNTWACVSLFAPDASTEGSYKADLLQRFDYDYRSFSHLMDRYLPDPTALDYIDRLARLTEVRAYARAQFLREDANLDWTAIGAKVKKLIDDRIGAQVRKLMSPGFRTRPGLRREDCRPAE